MCLQLVHPIEFSERQQPVDLCQRDVSVGDQVIISGWGATNWNPAGSFDTTSALQKMGGKIVSRTRCIRQHGIILYHDQLCAYTRRGKGICTVSQHLFQMSFK